MSNAEVNRCPPPIVLGNQPFDILLLEIRHSAVLSAPPLTEKTPDRLEREI